MHALQRALFANASRTESRLRSYASAAPRIALAAHLRRTALRRDDLRLPLALVWLRRRRQRAHAQQVVVVLALDLVVEIGHLVGHADLHVRVLRARFAHGVLSRTHWQGLRARVVVLDII